MRGSTEQILNRLADGYSAMSPQIRRAAQYLLDNPNEIGVSSMRQVAAAANVKPNTLVRMARTLGFDSYEEFREPFREWLRNRADSYPDRARWLQSIAQGNSHGQLYSQMAAASLANIEQAFSGTSADELKAAADAIVLSRKAYVIGVGIGHSLAHNFWYVAHMAFDNLVLVPSQGGNVIDGVARCGRGDVVLAMTFQPYRVEIVQATRLARERGAELIAITDSRTSPIARDARYVFIVPTNTPQFFMSGVAVHAFLEALIAFMVADADRRVVANIDDFHRVRHDAGLYWRD